MLTRADKILIITILAIGILGISYGIANFSGNAGQVVEIYSEGRLTKSISLKAHQVIRLGNQEHFNIIEINGGRVRMFDADCSDEICIKTDWISQPPQQIVCLPHRVMVKIVGGAEGEIDDVAR